tara:strand:- start:2470 stop:2880 length:411 start_codon:yes stop_codon:yes gene_type:complete
MKVLIMKKAFVLNSNNYIMYAMKHYENPQCLDIEEFYGDLSRIKYLKRLLRRYTATGELKERLILNHIIVLYNVFGIVPATRLLFFRMGDEFHSVLKTFLVYLNVFPEGEKEEEVPEADLVSIPLDKGITEILRKI